MILSGFIRHVIGTMLSRHRITRMNAEAEARRKHREELDRKSKEVFDHINTLVEKVNSKDIEEVCSAEFRVFVKDLLEETKRPALILHRPYPTQASLSGRSKLGGLPQLPEDHEWPVSQIRVSYQRESIVSPMHFLAQIDCAELPEVMSDFPNTGMLFFFALVDEVCSWTDSKSSDGTAVIYVPELAVGTPLRQPPKNIMAIEELVETSYRVDRLWTQELDGKVYPEWPIVPIAFESFLHPTSWERFGDQLEQMALTAGAKDFAPRLHQQLYSKYYAQKQRASIDRALTSTLDQFQGSPAQINEGASKLALDDSAFPSCGLLARDVASAVGSVALTSITDHEKNVARRRKRGDSSSVEFKDEEKFRAWDRSARAWISRLEKTPLDLKLSTKVRQEFRGWLTDSQILRYLGKDDKFRFATHQGDFIVAKGLRRSFQTAAVSPEFWSHFDSRYLKQMYSDHEPYSDDFRPGGKKSSYLHHKLHQMFGHFQSTQVALKQDDPRVSLLHLNSDYGIGFMFGDVGEIQFLISPDDLKNRRFDRVDVLVNGG